MLRFFKGFQPERIPLEFPALTGIRFPLALWVVICHLSGSGRMMHGVVQDSPELFTIIDSAYVALGTFFAMSGFLLARGYRHVEWNGTSLTRYWTARLARIYPLYLASLLVLAPIIASQLRHEDLGTAADRAGLVLNYAALLQGWRRLPVDWNTPAWSLSCEMFFYACFPAILLLVRRRGWGPAMAAAGAAIAIPVMVRLLGIPLSLKPVVYFGDFLTGVAVAMIYTAATSRGPALNGRGHWLYLPAMAGGILLLLYSRSIQPFELYDSGVRIANGAMILGLAFGGGWVCRLLSRPSVLWGGRISYGIYILHIPLLWWFERYTFDKMLPWPQAVGAYLLAVLVCSAAAHLLVEEPANATIRDWVSSRRRRLVEEGERAQVCMSSQT